MPMTFRNAHPLAVLALLLSGNGTVGQPLAARDAPVRGVVRPVDQAAISSELSARIIALPRKEGESFQKGDLLIAFDCRRHQAEAQAADAAYREAKVMHESQVYLQRNQAGSKFDIETSRARAEKAEAESSSLKVRLDQCQLAAPFKGRIAELALHVHETPTPGKAFLTIIDDSSLEVELIAPSAWLKWLEPGTAFSFQVDETGSLYTSHVARIGASVDPVSQTVKIVGRLDQPDSKVIAGMSGTASFESER